ncbi:MAG: hypothetical protein KDA20_08290 [Phycisphaerales bacterium]|nr:hypothetical protein [Phycisphaerales bacterium]
MRGSTKRPAFLMAALLLSGTSAFAGASDALDRAADLLDAGLAIEARTILVEAQADATDAATRERLHELLGNAERRIQTMSEQEVKLQRAELFLKRGDLRQAFDQAENVRRADRSTGQEKLRASDLLDEIARQQDALLPTIDATLAQAEQDFLRGSYADAKAGFSAVNRSGVRLSQGQQRTLNRYTTRLLQLEREHGAAFEGATMSAGALAPAAIEAVSGAAVAQQDAFQPIENNQQDMFDQVQRANAQRVLQEADADRAAGRLIEAANGYTAVTTDPLARFLSDAELSRAESSLREVRALLGGTQGGNLDQEIAQREQRRQQTTTEVTNLLAQGQQALAAGNVDDAQTSLSEARLRWRRGYTAGLFNETEFAEKMGELDNFGRTIESTRASILEREKSRQAAQLEQEAAKQASEAQSERDRLISGNLDRLQALQAEQKYEEALQVIDEILFIDPINPTARFMKTVIEDIMVYRKYMEIDRDRSLSYAQESLTITEATIVPATIMDFPPDWPEISLRRGAIDAFVESEADRRVLASLESRKIPATFSDDRLEDVLAFIGTVTNLNVDVDWDSLADIGIERDEPVDLQLSEVSARIVLQRVLQKVSPDEFTKAGFAVQDGIIVVASDQDLRKRTFIVIYDVRDLLFDVPDFEDVPELDVSSVLNQSQGRGGGGGGGNIFNTTNTAAGIQLTPQELLDRLKEIIQTNVDFDGWQANGGDTGVIQELNNNLIITNTAANHREIQGLLRQLREIRNLQISVEARFLLVSQDFFEQIGFDLDVFLNVDSAQYDQVLAQWGLAENPAEIPDFQGIPFTPGQIVSGLGRRPGFVQGRPVFALVPNENYNPDAEFPDPDAEPFVNAFFPATSTFTPAPQEGGLGIIPAEQNSFGITSTLLEGSAFASQILAQNPALSVAGTFFDDIQVDFLVQATQADRRSVVLNAPRLTFTNGKSATIAVVNQQGFISDLQPIIGTSAVAFDPVPATVNEGFTLKVRGVASSDRRYVTMGVEASLATLKGFDQQTVSAIVGGDTTGTGGGGSTIETADSNIQLPLVQFTRVQTGVTVPDQGTILLGGQRLTTEIETESGVPVLSKLPILNRFFSNRATSKEEQTLLLLIKPTIIIQGEEEERAFPGLSDRLANPFGY